MARATSITLKKQDSNKKTVSPVISSEISLNTPYTITQMDMVSGSYGIIANNTELNVFGSTVKNGSAPILAEDTSMIEVEQSTFTGKNNNVDNSKVVIGINDNNILVDQINDSSKNRITREAAIDKSNSVNFPSPGPGYLSSYKTVLENNADDSTEDFNNPIACAPLVNDGINFEMGNTSGSILRMSYTIDLTKQHKDFYGKDSYNSYNSFVTFINNLPRDLNGHKLTIIFDTTFSGNITFNKFYGGILEIQGSYNGQLIFNQCQNINFNNFNTSARITFSDCPNIISTNGTFNGQFTVNRSKCHFISGNFNANPVIASNELAHILFDQCNIVGKLCVSSNGSQISSVNPVNTSDELMNKNFSAETTTENTINAKHSSNHYHISMEHDTNSYPIGVVYGWPRAYTRGDLKRAITRGGANLNWQVSVLPTISGLTSNYFPAGDLPLDMFGDYNVSPYNTTNYNNTHNLTPVGIQTISGFSGLSVFDWYKCYNDSFEAETQFPENYAINSVRNSMNNLIQINASDLYTEQNISNMLLNVPNVYVSLDKVDPGKASASRTASITIEIAISNQGFKVISTTTNSYTGTDIYYTINISGLARYIPENLRKFVRFEYLKNTEQDSLTGCQSKPFKAKSRIGTWRFANCKLYVPYVSVLGHIKYALITPQFLFTLRDSNNNIISNYSYSKPYSDRYDVNPDPIYPNVLSYINLSPVPRNISGLIADDWYLFSDSILAIKCGNTYKSRGINNYYDTYCGDSEYEDINHTYPYFMSICGTNTKFIHDIGQSSTVLNMSTQKGALITRDDPDIYINAIAAIGDPHYEPLDKSESGNGDFYLVRFSGSEASIACPNGVTADQSVYNTFNALEYNSLIYENNAVISYYNERENVGGFNNIKVYPLQSRRNENTAPEINDDCANIFVDKYETNKTKNASVLRFHPNMTHMIMRHSLLRSCEEFFTTINGIRIAANSYHYYKTPNTFDKNIDTTWPPNNAGYLNGFSNAVKNIFNNTVGNMYPMVTGDFTPALSTYTALNVNDKFHQSETNPDVYLPFTSLHRNNLRPVYFGIPYVVSDSYGDITYAFTNSNNTDFTNLKFNSCSSVLGGQPNLGNNSALAMPYFNKYKISANDKDGYFLNSNALLTINNLYKIHEKIINSSSLENAIADGTSAIVIRYNRRFAIETGYPASYGIKFTYYNNVYDTRGWSVESLIDDIDSFKNSITALRAHLNSVNPNNAAIKIDYKGAQEFSHIFTNINNYNKGELIASLDAANTKKVEEAGFEGSYYTYIVFKTPYEWEIFYKHYMHKNYFIISKLNRFYRCFTTQDRDNVAKNISLLNIIQFNPTAVFYGSASEKLMAHGSNYNITNEDGVSYMFRLVGQMYYPIGSYTPRQNNMLIETNDGPDSSSRIQDNELFIDKGNWARDDFSLDSILGSSAYMRRS